MFTELGQIWTHQLRKTEATDTHAYIRQHQRDEGKNNARQDAGHGEMFDSDDVATVSVAALDAFLRSILNAHPEIERKPSLHEAAKDIQTPKARKKIPKPGMRAQINAYAHAAETRPEPHPFEISKEQGNKLNLSAQELEDIQALISDLEQLKGRNIQHLRIAKAATFLESLKNSVSYALSQT